MQQQFSSLSGASSSPEAIIDQAPHAAAASCLHQAAMPSIDRSRLKIELDAAPVRTAEPRREASAISAPLRDAEADMRRSNEALSSIERLRAYVKAPFMWAAGAALNGYNIYKILDIVKFHPMPGGLIASDHPWATGTNPESGKSVWESNVVFRTCPDKSYADSDEMMMQKSGKFLARMTALSAASQRYPDGSPRVDESGALLRRMPHAVNYIHGSAHYNGGWLIFNNFKEAFHYFNDRQFRKEIRRFAREERREIVILFRDKEYSTAEYAHLGGFLRTQFPWYSNTNGPKDLVHWGSRAPYATINMITGHFRADMQELQSENGAAKVVREPVPAGEYFQGEYNSRGRLSARFTERLFSKAIDMRIRTRAKDKGNLFFVDKREIEDIHRRKHMNRTVRDEGKNISWKVRGQKFNGSYVAVNDLSPFRDEKGVIPLPSAYDPKRDVLIAISPDYHFHTFLVADNREYHGTFLYRNPATIRAPQSADRIRARMVVRLKDLPEETVAELRRYMNELEGSRSGACTQGVLHALKHGAGLELKSSPGSSLSISGFFKSLVADGIVDKDGKPVAMEIYSGEPELDLERTHKEMFRKRDLRFGIFAPLIRLQGKILELLNDGKPGKVIVD